MKKFLLSLLTVAAGAFASSAEEVTFDFVNNDYGMTRYEEGTTYNTNPTTITGDNGFTIKFNDANNRLWTDGMRLYKGASMEITAPEGATLSKVQLLKSDTAAASNIGTQSGNTQSNLTNATWTGSAASVKLYCNISKNAQTVGKIIITYTGDNGGSEDPQPQPTLGEITLNGKAVVENGTYSYEEGTTLIFAAENAESMVITVLDSEAATIIDGVEVKANTYTWTPSIADTYTVDVKATAGEETKKKSFDVEITAKAETPTPGSQTTMTFDFVNKDYGLTRLSGQTSEYNSDPTTITSEGVSILLNGNTRLWSDGMRFYKESSFTISAPAETKIIKIVYEKAANIVLAENEAGQYENLTWTGSAENVKFSCTLTNRNTAVPNITVTYAENEKPDEKPAEIVGLLHDDVIASENAIKISYTLHVKNHKEGRDKYTVEVTLKDGEGNIVATQSNSDHTLVTENENGGVAVYANEEATHKLSGSVKFENLKEDTSYNVSYKYGIGETASTDHSTTDTVSTTTTSIEEVGVAESAVAEWYDLSGRRVAAPGKGVYVRKQGSNVKKYAF